MVDKKFFTYGVKLAKEVKRVKRRWPKIISGVVLILILTTFLLTALVPISPGVLSKFGISLDEVLAGVEAKLGRKVSIEDFWFYLLRGGTFEGIEIANHKDFSKTPFFKADRIVIKYALLSLIRKELVIKKIILVKPQLLIERDKEGKWNFSDLVTTEKVSPVGKPTASNGTGRWESEQVSGETGQLANGLTGQPVNGPTGQPANRPTGQPANWQTGKLASWLTGQLANWLTGKQPKSFTSQAYAETNDGEPARMAVTVSSIALQKGRIIFNDEVISQIMAIEDINILISNISPEEKADFDISLNIPEEMATPVKIKASFNPFTFKDKMDLDVRLDIDDLDLVYFAPYYKSFLPGKLQSAKLNLELDLGLRKEIFSRGKITLSDFIFIPMIGIPLPVKFGSLTIDHDLKIDLEKSNLDIEKLNLNLDGLSLNAKGKVSDFKKKRRLDLSLYTDQLPLKKVKNLVSSFVRVPILKEIEVAGTIDLKVDLKGILKKLRIDGVLNLNDNTIKYAKINQPLRNIKARIKFNKKNLNIPRLSAKLGGSRIVLAGKISNFKKPWLNLLLTSNKLVLNELVSITALPKAEKGSTITGIASLNTRITGPVKELNLAGVISIPQLKLDKLELSDTALDYSFRLSERLLNIKSLKTNLYQGNLNASGSLNLSDPKKLEYSLKANAEEIDLNELLSANTDLKDQFYGTLGLDLEITGKGTDKEALAGALGRGYLNLAKGKITGIAVQQELTKFLLSVLQIPAIEEIHYDSLSGHFNLAGGEVRTDDFLLDGKELKVLASGSYFLDGRLDFDVTVKPTPLLIGASSIPAYLKDEAGNAVIPFRITGTTQKPEFTPEWEKIIEKAIETEIEGQLEKAIGKEEAEVIKGVIKNIRDLFKSK